MRYFDHDHGFRLCGKTYRMPVLCPFTSATTCANAQSCRWPKGEMAHHAHLDLHLVQLHQRLELRAALLVIAAVLAAVFPVGRSCTTQPDRWA